MTETVGIWITWSYHMKINNGKYCNKKKNSKPNAYPRKRLHGVKPSTSLSCEAPRVQIFPRLWSSCSDHSN